MTKMIAGPTLALAAAAALSALSAHPALAAEKPLPPPVEDEAHGLKGSDREAALLVLRSHYQNFLETYGPLPITGADWKDPSKPARCRMRADFSGSDLATDLPKGSFVEGLPVRGAQASTMDDIWQHLAGDVAYCSASGNKESIVFTKRTWAQVEQSALALVMKNSGTTFCLKDADCSGVEITDPCGIRPPLRAFSSATTDAVLQDAYRKFLPRLMTNITLAVDGTRSYLGDKHPDGKPTDIGRCPMKHWEESSIKAICIQHSCRAEDAPIPK